MKALTIEQWPLERLRPYARDLTKQDDATVARMADLVRTYGMRLPLLATSDGWIIDGKLRLKAVVTLTGDEVERLGLATLPVIPADDLRPEEVRALRLALKRSASWAPWDKEALAEELLDLEALDVDLSLTGFDEEELRALLGDVAATDLPTLPSGDKDPFQQMVFTLHDQQAERVKEALSVSKGMGHFDQELNRNSNGNALARVCDSFLAAHA
ncbi:MAG: hypothetical protein C4525_03090 [Desulfarculus sp.]|jgi:ParB-like chromosome segregation protein Spo0J|nr:MAG: hypothetical protein C4525_03090 [Desulfarculus sp.]